MRNKVVNYLLISVMFAFLVLGSTLLLTGCGPKNYDLSGISFNDATVNYDGTAKFIRLEGTLPEGLEVNYKYYTNETYETEATSTVDAGTYYVKANFTAAKGYNTPESLTAKLVINKIDFANVNFVVTATNEDYETNAEAKLNSDGSFYFEANNKLYEKITVTNNKGVNQSVKFYKDEQHTIEAPAALQNFGQKVYAVVTLTNKNFNDATFDLEIRVERKTIELKSYEDLLIMYDHIHGKNPLDQTARLNIRYLLANDIDCADEQGNPRLWKSIAGLYSETIFFCSEFDGNDHTISNLKYNINSVDKDVAGSENGLFISFFGNASDCYIHNVTFSNISIEVKAGDFERVDHETWGAQNPLYAAVVVGRLESAMVDSNKPSTFIHDITVKNCDIRVDAFKMYVGAIIAKDQVTDSVTSTRDNLHVENCNIYAISTEYMDSMWVGGISGVTDQSTGYLYTNCSVKNLKIGFDYESYEAATTKAEKNKYISLVNEAIVGGFVGTIGTQVKFVNCTLDNYLIATTRKTGYYGSLSRKVEFENCSHTQSNPNWNEIKGVYNYTDKVDESELNWNDATYVKPEPKPAITQVSTNKEEYLVGEKIVVNVTAAKEDIDENNLHYLWVGLYRKGDFDANNGAGYLAYVYLYDNPNYTASPDGSDWWTKYRSLKNRTTFFLVGETTVDWGVTNATPETMAEAIPDQLDAGEYELVLINDGVGSYYAADRVEFSIVEE